MQMQSLEFQSVRYINSKWSVCSFPPWQTFSKQMAGLGKRGGRWLRWKFPVACNRGHFNDESSSHYLDLAAFEFTEPCEAHPDLKERFFDLRGMPPDARNTDIVVAVVAGFPSKDTASSVRR
jgi:hypothetical protein